MESRPWGFNAKLLPQHLHGQTKESNVKLQYMLVVAKTSVSRGCRLDSSFWLSDHRLLTKL